MFPKKKKIQFTPKSLQTNNISGRVNGNINVYLWLWCYGRISQRKSDAGSFRSEDVVLGLVWWRRHFLAHMSIDDRTGSLNEKVRMWIWFWENKPKANFILEPVRRLTHLCQLRVSHGLPVPKTVFCGRRRRCCLWLRVLGWTSRPLQVIGQLSSLLSGRGIVPDDLLALGGLSVYVHGCFSVNPGEEATKLNYRPSKTFNRRENNI